MLEVARKMAESGLFNWKILLLLHNLIIFAECYETVVLAEGSSIDLLCTPREDSSGYIIWTLNDSNTPFNQTDYSCNKTESGPSPVPCIAYSNLHIVNVQQVQHEGTYKCISFSDANSSNSTIITNTKLQVHVPPIITSTTPSDTSIQVEAGNCLNVEVSVVNVNQQQIQWTFNGPTVSRISDNLDIVNSIRRHPPLINSTLQLTSVVPTNSGRYTVSATNMAGNVSITFAISITAAAVITYPNSNINIFIEEEKEAILTCSARGFPSLSISWSRNTNGLQNISIMNSTDRDGYHVVTSQVFINTINRNDFGVYICSAINGDNDNVNENDEYSTQCDGASIQTFPNNQTYSVVRPYGSYITSSPDDQILQSFHGVVNFTCTAKGFPLPNITWMLDNGMELYSVPVTMDRQYISSTLIVNTSKLSSPVIVFTCHANNYIGNSEAHFSLSIFMPAEFSLTPTSRVVTSPNNASFVCKASGVPMPLITWSGSDRITLSAGNKIRITELQKPDGVQSVLEILMTSPAESGIYWCFAKNSIENTTVNVSTNVSLTVNVVPNITSYLPDGSSRYVVNVAGDITFQCTATGVPPPDIQWYKGDVMLSSSSMRITIVNLIKDMPERSLATVTRELTLSNTSTSDASANYSCRASNAAMPREDSEMFELFVQDIPVPPIVYSLNRFIDFNESAEVCFLVDNYTDLQWYYTSNSSLSNPQSNLNSFQEITHLDNRTSSSNLTFSSDNLCLTITRNTQTLRNTFETDQGRYFLQATNLVGVASNYTDVIVNELPRVLVIPQYLTVTNNESSVSFFCTAVRQHNYTWTYTSLTGHNKIITENGIKYFIIQQNIKTEKLIITNVSYEDLGTYTCSVANRVGSNMDTGTLSIFESPTTSLGAGQNQTETVLKGGSLNISCTFTGVPVPTITWTLNNQPTTFNDSDVATNTIGTTTPGNVMSTLYIVDAQYPTHDGIYTCTGSNTVYGLIFTSNVSITVQVQVIPEVQLTANQIRVVFGDSVSLNCTVLRGNPTIYTFSWSLNGDSISGFTSSLSSSTFVIGSITEGAIGVYSCRADNTVGMGMDTTNITLGDTSNTVVITDITSHESLQEYSSTSFMPMINPSIVGALVGGIVSVFIVLVLIIITVTVAILLRKCKLKGRGKFAVDIAKTSGCIQQEEVEYEYISSEACSNIADTQLENAPECTNNPSYEVVCIRSDASWKEAFYCDDNPAYDAVKFANNNIKGRKSTIPYYDMVQFTPKSL